MKTEPVQLPEVQPERRRFVSAMATALAGGGSFFGPWAHTHVWSQSAAAKPLVIGLTMDASGQYAASGGEERLGAYWPLASIVRPITRGFDAALCDHTCV